MIFIIIMINILFKTFEKIFYGFGFGLGMGFSFYIFPKNYKKIRTIKQD